MFELFLKYTIIKQNQEFNFELSHKKIKELKSINDISIEINSKETKKTSGVTIVIREIPHLDIPIDTLKQKLLSNFNINEDFQIFINGDKLERMETHFHLTIQANHSQRSDER